MINNLTPCTEFDIFDPVERPEFPDMETPKNESKNPVKKDQGTIQMDLFGDVGAQTDVKTSHDATEEA